MLLNSTQIPFPPKATRKKLLRGLEFRLQHFLAKAKNSTNDDTTGIQINPWAFLPSKAYLLFVGEAAGPPQGGRRQVGVLRSGMQLLLLLRQLMQVMLVLVLMMAS